MQIKINSLLVVTQTKVYIGKYFKMNSSSNVAEVFQNARAFVRAGFDE